jgi:hypothetical protein
MNEEKTMQRITQAAHHEATAAGHISSDRYASPENSGSSPSRKPAVNVTIVNRHDALDYLPRLADAQKKMAAACSSAGVDASATAILLTADSVGVNAAHSAGPVLVANVPAYLSPLLGQLAACRPEITNWTTLDLRESHTLLMWGVRDQDGQEHAVALPANILTMLPTSENPSQQTGPAFARIAFCSGDQVAFTGFWVNDSDIDEAQAGEMSGMQWWHHSDEQLATAHAKTDAAGSATPWLGKPWIDDEGLTLTQLHLLVPNQFNQ